MTEVESLDDLKKKVTIELSKEEATEITMSIVYCLQPMLCSAGMEEVDKTIKCYDKIISKLLKHFPEIVEHKEFQKDFWTKFEQHRMNPSELRILGVEEMQKTLSSSSDKDRIIERVPLGIKEKNAELLAGEIIELAKKEYPECLNEHYIHEDIIGAFWKNKGISSKNAIIDPSVRLKMIRAETLARKSIESMAHKINFVASGATEEEIEVALQFLDKLCKKSAEEIVEELLGFAEEKSIAFSSSDQIITAYLAEKSILYNRLMWDYSPLGHHHDPLRESVSQKIYEITKTSLSAKLEKKHLNALAQKIVEWAKGKGISNITKTDIALFFKEEEFAPPSAKVEFINMIYRLIKLGQQ